MHDEDRAPHHDDADTEHYEGAAGGWGSVRGIMETLVEERDSPAVLRTLWRQNKPGGFMCTSCAWTKPAKYHTFEFCENGAKATLWELTSRRCTPDFFAQHTVSELRGWRDYDLEQQGRLTHPLRYDRTQDKYVACSWEEAFAAIAPASTASIRNRRSSTPRAMPALRRPISMRCSPALRPQQPARQLQHVPRDHVGGAQEGDRIAGRYRGP